MKMVVAFDSRGPEMAAQEAARGFWRRFGRWPNRAGRRVSTNEERMNEWGEVRLAVEGEEVVLRWKEVRGLRAGDVAVWLEED